MARLKYVSYDITQMKSTTNPAQVIKPPASQRSSATPLLLTIASTTVGVTKIPVPNILFSTMALMFSQKIEAHTIEAENTLLKSSQDSLLDQPASVLHFRLASAHLQAAGYKLGLH